MTAVPGGDVLMAEPSPYDYDLVVIGGGSGGLACSKAAAALGARVAVLDFVQPSPRGTTWGLGGTCVNVGCIPKKLMHQAALLGHGIEDARHFGWEVPAIVGYNWATLVQGVQDHIGSLNWGYRVALQDKNVTYINAYGSFLDPHTLNTVNKRKQVKVITSDKFVIATGGRPSYPDIPGAREFGITSDDLFSLQTAPGKTLIIGASYVALECAGFLAGLGYDTAVMVRSILLRGFDQEVAEKIGAYMAKHQVRFIRPAVPTKIEKDSDGRLVVSFESEGMHAHESFDTVIFAVGRYACTGTIGLDKAGVLVDQRTGKIAASAAEETNVPNIYAIGDVLLGKPELTPVAIQAGKLLADRLFGGSTRLCNYSCIPTTVFTPLEYGCCGLAEEDAEAKYGKENIEVFHQSFQPLEFTVAHREPNACFGKLICNKADEMRVVGLHILGPNAGEVTQGFGLGMKMHATKADFDDLIGIHPTVAEVFTTMSITKASGGSAEAAGC